MRTDQRASRKKVHLPLLRNGNKEDKEESFTEDNNIKKQKEKKNNINGENVEGNKCGIMGSKHLFW